MDFRGNKSVTIKYRNGATDEAVILSRTDTTIRAAVRGHEDVELFTSINGTWVSEDCEPVQIEFAWEQCPRQEVVSEADCICPKMLAARLIQSLLIPGPELSAASFLNVPGSRPEACPLV